jgi:hypothetical protein
VWSGRFSPTAFIPASLAVRARVRSYDTLVW